MGTVRLIVETLPRGGVVVTEPARGSSEMATLIYASSDIDGVCAFLRAVMKPGEAERPSGDPTRPRHETVADTADLNQYGRNALAHAVNRRRA